MKGALKSRREELRMTQKAMAELLGVSQQTVARWETTDQIPNKHLKDVVVKLGMSISDFLKGEAAPKTVPTMEFPDAPFGALHLMVGDHELSYPTGWSQVAELFESLSSEFLPMRSWLLFETLDHRVVYIYTRSIDSVRWVDDAQEEMPSFEHEEVYKAASMIAVEGAPTEEELASDTYPYSREMVSKVLTFIQEKGEDEVYDWLNKTTYITQTGAIGTASVTEELIWAMDLLLTDGLEHRKFIDLTSDDETIKLLPAEKLSLVEFPYLEMATVLKRMEQEATN